MAYNSTHDSEEDFFSSLDPLQRAALHLLNDSNEQAKFIQQYLAFIWDTQPEIRFEIGLAANDYWRQFTFSNDFDDLHDGQRLHVLGTLYSITTKYINEHNEISSKPVQLSLDNTITDEALKLYHSPEQQQTRLQSLSKKPRKSRKNAKQSNL